MKSITSTSKSNKVKKAKTVKAKVKPDIAPELRGLDQSFIDRHGNAVLLKDFLKEGDWWELKNKKSIRHIIYHDAVKKLADAAGINSVVNYNVLIQPSVSNNYMLLLQATVTDEKGRSSTGLGETNRSNLGLRGRANPGNMAEKRAYDRAVFNHLRITGLLGEDELPDEPEEQEMEKLTDEEKKIIAPLINEIWAAKTKNDLSAFNKRMTSVKGSLNEKQLDILRGLYKKKMLDFIPKKF